MFYWIAASVVDAATINHNGNKTFLGTGFH